MNIICSLARRHRTALAELIGSSTIVVALATWNGVAAAVAAGIAVLAKSMEWGLDDQAVSSKGRGG